MTRIFFFAKWDKLKLSIMKDKISLNRIEKNKGHCFDIKKDREKENIIGHEKVFK